MQEAKLSSKLFLAGATGAIGTRLIPILLDHGWRVMGMTRSPERADGLRKLGIEAAVADAFDAEAVTAAILGFVPQVVMHQLTDLPRDIAKLDDAWLERNARLRQVGTRNLVHGAEQAGAERIVAQSIAFSYAPGPMPYRETDRLAGRLPNASASSLGVVSLEDQLSASSVPSVILRYGRLYGPGTGSDRPWGKAALHIDAAAHAAALAARSETTGVFNIAENDGEVDSSRARDHLGWSPDWRPAIDREAGRE